MRLKDGEYIIVCVKDKLRLYKIEDWEHRIVKCIQRTGSYSVSFPAISDIKVRLGLTFKPLLYKGFFFEQCLNMQYYNKFCRVHQYRKLKSEEISTARLALDKLKTKFVPDFEFNPTIEFRSALTAESKDYHPKTTANFIVVRDYIDLEYSIFYEVGLSIWYERIDNTQDQMIWVKLYHLLHRYVIVRDTDIIRAIKNWDVQYNPKDKFYTSKERASITLEHIVQYMQFKYGHTKEEAKLWMNHFPEYTKETLLKDVPMTLVRKPKDLYSNPIKCHKTMFATFFAYLMSGRTIFNTDISDELHKFLYKNNILAKPFVNKSDGSTTLKF
jgi:hypothetical protein